MRCLYLLVIATVFFPRDASRAAEVFRDDFDGDTLDTNHWALGTWSLGRTRLGKSPLISNGLAHLRLDTFNPADPGHSFLGTEILSKTSFPLGVGLEFEARVRVNPLPSGLVTSFFTYTSKTVNSIVYSDEIDFEFLSKQINQSPAASDPVLATTWNDWNNNQPAYNDPNHYSSINENVPNLNLSEFNTVTIRWLPGQVDWLVNGKVIRTAKNAVPDENTPVRLNFWAPTSGWNDAYSASLVPGASAAANTTYFYDVDYVTVRTVEAKILGRHVFYNDSKFDGNNPGASAGDDAAIAIDKTALLPGGTATLANYTSFSKGINGIDVDSANLAGTPTATDFTFKIGNSNAPSQWSPLTVQPSIVVRKGAGENGSDRIEIIFPNGAITKEWLQVIVGATSNTGLTTPDVFYFGNAPGEAGNSPGNSLVSAIDEIEARNDPHGILNPAQITNRHDYNRDGFVNAADQIVARNHGTTLINALRLISVPATLAAAPVPEPSALTLIAIGVFVASSQRSGPMFNKKKWPSSSLKLGGDGSAPEPQSNHLHF